MNRSNAILERLRTEKQLATNGGHPILANSFGLAIEEIERLRAWIRKYGETGAWPDEVARALSDEQSAPCR